MFIAVSIEGEAYFAHILIYPTFDCVPYPYVPDMTDSRAIERVLRVFFPRRLNGRGAHTFAHAHTIPLCLH